MAPRNIARPSTPPPPPEAPPDPAALLEEKSTMLHSLLCYCHGNGPPQQEDAGPVHRNNVFWLASVLAKDVVDLVQVCLKQDR
ncbi:hypothetical protein SAMN05216567_11051 [Variovorax sp. OK605]|nr:hypothetical protein SAMN05216567_11051 [Variovorax sp. OK605]